MALLYHRDHVAKRLLYDMDSSVLSDMFFWILFLFYFYFTNTKIVNKMLNEHELPGLVLIAEDNLINL